MYRSMSSSVFWVIFLFSVSLVLLYTGAMYIQSDLSRVHPNVKLQFPTQLTLGEMKRTEVALRLAVQSHFIPTLVLFSGIYLLKQVNTKNKKKNYKFYKI